jgi:hypothetical protein
MRSIVLAAVLFFLLTACLPAQIVPPSPLPATATPSRTPAGITPAAPTPSFEPPETDATASAPAPTRLSLAEIDHLFKSWVAATLFPLSPDPNLTLTEITPEQVWEALEAQIFVVTDPIFVYRPTFLVHQGSIMELGAGFDGLGMKPQDFVVTDLNGDGRPELVFTTTLDGEVMQISRVVKVSWSDAGAQVLEADQTYRGRIELQVTDSGSVQVFGRAPGEQIAHRLGELVQVSDRRLTIEQESEAAPAWIDYTSERFRISFQIPGGYTQIDDDHFEGDDSFITIQPYQGPAMAEISQTAPIPQGAINFSLARACNLEINTEPRRYGPEPSVRLVAFETPSERCLVSPDPDVGDSHALILFRTPGGSLAKLQTTPDMLEIINQTLVFDLSEALTVQEPRPFNPESSPDLEMETTALGELTMEAYRLFPEGDHTPLDQFSMKEILAGPLSKRSERRGTYYELPLSKQIEVANASIAPSGFRLELQEPLDEGKLKIYEGDTFVLQDFSLFSPASAGTGPDGEPDFALVINIPDKPPGTFLVRNNDILPFDMENKLWTPPVFVDGGMAVLEISKKTTGSLVIIKLEGEPVYTFTSAYPNPVYADLMNWGGRWALQLDGLFIIDGHIMNPGLNAAEIFKPGLLNGRPFFFFTREGQSYLSYGGQALDVVFDEVMHNVGWGGGINPEINNQMVWFYARMNGWWYYVEIGRY